MVRKEYFFTRKRRVIIMAFECNIDARGKAHRLRIGLLAIVAGLVLAVLSWIQFEVLGIGIHWIIPLGVLAGGSFAVFEGWSGWCAARAMGFKTPI